MPHAEAVQRIDEPADRVVDFLAEGAHSPRWQRRVIRTEREGGPLGVGTRYRQSMRHPLGFRVSSDYEVTEFDRPRTTAFRVISGGPVRPTGTFRLSPVDPGTTEVATRSSTGPTGSRGWRHPSSRSPLPSSVSRPPP